MANQTPKNPAIKKESGQPTYGDQPWQTPEENDQKDEHNDDSCGCAGGGKVNKKSTSAK